MTLFNEAAQTRIKKWNPTLDQTVQIKLLLPESNEAADEALIKKENTAVSVSNQFSNLSEQFQALAPGVKITSTRGDTLRPGFSITENIMFSAFPMEKELPPFLSALALIDKTGPDTTVSALDPSLHQSLDRIDIPVHLKLYIALFCPHCPKMVETLVPLALQCNNIRLDIIDGSLFEQAAREDGVLSAPCLILDNDFRWTGQVEPEEIIEMILNRDPSQLGMETLKNIMEQGDAAWISKQMTGRKKIFDAFVELLCHPTWSVRLGAMVVVEELAENDPELCAALCPMLVDVFAQKEVSIQGDLLYALGEAGDKATAQWIGSQLPGFSHPDLIDAAKEALDSIKDRH